MSQRITFHYKYQALWRWYTAVLNTLVQEYNELSEEKQHMCDMIADKTPERTVADEMGIRQSTLNGRKNAMLYELHKKMKDFE